MLQQWSDPVPVCEVPDLARGWPSVSFGNVNRAPCGPEGVVDRVRLGADDRHGQV